MMRNMWAQLLKVSALAAIIGFHSFVAASELLEPYTSVRGLGMGNAFTAVAEQGDAIFYNPAALARVSGFHWTIIDPAVGANGTQAVEVANIAAGTNTMADKISNLYGKSIWLGGGAKTSFVFPGFGIAGYTHGDVGLNLQNPAYPQMNLNYIFDYGIAIGGAIDFIPGIWSLGMTVRRVNRTGTNLPLGPSVLATLDLDAIKNQLKNRGSGYGLDVGTLITIPGPVRPTLAVTIRNAGYTAFSFEEGVRAPPRAEPDITVGASFVIDAPLVKITPAIDYRYFDRTDIQNGKKLHVGAEIELPLLSLRAGLYQGYYSAGVGLDAGVLAIDAATWGVELGEYPGQLEDRRYMVQMTLQLGLDADAFSFGGLMSGGSGGSGGRRKLKQRR